MRGGTRSGAGRKPAHIDLVELEKLSSLHCTDQEIASFFHVSVRTIEKRRKQSKFAEAMERGKAKGRISIRRAQMRQMEGGNSVMTIWFGKQLLGQRDVTPMELSGPNTQEARISLEVLDEALRQSRKQRRTR